MQLTHELLFQEAAIFAHEESRHNEPMLFGVTDGKKVGTYLEAKFQNYLTNKNYIFGQGNAANGLDFPSLNIDMKVTSIKQPQSSSPYQSIHQRIYGLGYGLLVFVYDKIDDHQRRTANLRIVQVVAVRAENTGDEKLTHGVLEILRRQGSPAEILALLNARGFPATQAELQLLVDEIMRNPPQPGYVTLTPALQWRLNYGGALNSAGHVPGVLPIYGGT